MVNDEYEYDEYGQKFPSIFFYLIFFGQFLLVPNHGFFLYLILMMARFKKRSQIF